MCSIIDFNNKINDADFINNFNDIMALYNLAGGYDIKYIHHRNKNENTINFDICFTSDSSSIDAELIFKINNKIHLYNLEYDMLYFRKDNFILSVVLKRCL